MGFWFRSELGLKPVCPSSQNLSRKLKIVEFVQGKVKLSILEQLVLSRENVTFIGVDVGRAQVASC